MLQYIKWGSTMDGTIYGFDQFYDPNPPLKASKSHLNYASQSIKRAFITTLDIYASIMWSMSHDDEQMFVLETMLKSCEHDLGDGRAHAQA